MTSGIQVTPEMRKAVYEDDCNRLGHIFHLGNAFGTNPNGSGAVLAGPENEFPQLTCSRCSKVWIIDDEPGDDYDDAETKLQGRLNPNDALNTRIKDMKDKRKNKDPKVK